MDGKHTALQTVQATLSVSACFQPCDLNTFFHAETYCSANMMGGRHLHSHLEHTCMHLVQTNMITLQYLQNLMQGSHSISCKAVMHVSHVFKRSNICSSSPRQKKPGFAKNMACTHCTHNTLSLVPSNRHGAVIAACGQLETNNEGQWFESESK